MAAAKKQSIPGRRQIYVMPPHWLQAAGSAAHSWYAEMTTASDKSAGYDHAQAVIAQLDGARNMGSAFEFMLSPEETFALMRALVLELGEMLRPGPRTKTGDAARLAAAEALALLTRGGRRV